MAKRLKKESNKTIYKIIVVLIFLIGIIMVLQYSGNYVVDEITDKANLIINNGNVTKSLKLDMFIDENETVYISKQDIENFFDPYIYYDEKYNQIITGSNTKIASIVVGSNEMYVNSSKVNISAPIIEKEGEYYIPFSELDDVYNVDTQYIAENNVVVIDSLNRKYSIATSGKDNSVKYKPTGLSKTIDKIEKGEIVTIANREDEESKDGWTRVRTDSGKIGYVKTKDLGTENVIREAFEETKNRMIKSGEIKKATIYDAISDLNYLSSGEGDFEQDYKNKPLTEYQKERRKNSKILYNHKATTHNKVAIDRINELKPGGRRLDLKEGKNIKSVHSGAYGRMRWEDLSKTIITRFDTPSSGVYIHPEQARTITPREAARLQSFDDDFIFYGNKSSVIKQIGNAVPPLLAYYLANVIKDVEEGKYDEK